MVKENALENSFIEKIAGIILASVISVLLWFLNYFEKDTIEDQIEFPTEFNIDDLTENLENEIVICESSKQFMEFDAIFSGACLAGKPKFSKEDFDRQIKEVNKSNYIIMIFPCFLCLFLLISALLIHNVWLMLFQFHFHYIYCLFLIKTEKETKSQ